MAKTTANISIDSKVKAQAQELFADLGMDLSTAVNLFLRQAIRENAIPFAITREVPNRLTQAALDAAARNEQDDVFGPFDTVEELMEALNAED